MLTFGKRLFAYKKIKATLPIDLVLVRNGVSEGAIAIKKANQGKKIEINEEFLHLHNSKWRLMNAGVNQAKITGKWIREHFPNNFDAYLTGEYSRSLETAASLGLPGAKWIPSIYLRPRDFGVLSSLDFLPDKKELSKHMANRERDAFYWTPPNGESIAHLTLRTERIIHWLRNHVPTSGSAIIVTHRDVMETMRIRIEHILQHDYQKIIMNAKEPFTLNYCSVLHYTRKNPKTGEISPLYKWMRIVTPWLGKYGTDRKFVEIVPREYTNETLMNEIASVQPVFKLNK